jgi:baculoviral IAP repeat-containing protein 7/8
MNTSKSDVYPKYSLQFQRIESFNNWPKDSTQIPEQLATAGFFYTGRGDRVTCFCCGGGLKDWEEFDQPWEQHAIWYRNCEYLKLMKGETYIYAVLNPSQISISDAENKNNHRLCKICYEAESNIAFVPCGHVIACISCAAMVNKCPYCNQKYETIQKLYFV